MSRGKVKPVAVSLVVYNSRARGTKREAPQLCQLNNEHRQNHNRQRHHQSKFLVAEKHNRREPKLPRNIGKEKNMLNKQQNNVKALQKYNLHPSNNPNPNRHSLFRSSKLMLQPKAPL
jgi:hypothetical protein